MSSYAWSPITKRGPLKFPGGKRLAMIITMNCEYWDLTKDTKEPYYAGGPPMLPDHLPGNVADYPNFTWREYGQRVGVWRLFKLFDQMGVPLSITMNAKTATERPEIIQFGKDRNWEFVAHNFEQGELLTRYTFDIEAERKLLDATLATFEKTIGRPARGWLSSSLRSTPNTPGLLAERGLLFFCDYMNDEQPYMIDTPHGQLVNVPYSIEINDFTYFHRRAMNTWDAARMLKANFDQLYEEGAETGMLMNIGLHPHVSGHPHRLECYREFLSYAKSRDDIWWTTREEMATWYLQNQERHIP